MIEGLGCVLAAMMGTGNGTTSYSENIGIIEITKIASRRVILCGGIMMILLGWLTKISAILVLNMKKLDVFKNELNNLKLIFYSLRFQNQ